MRDVLFVTLPVVFFVGAAAYVRGCARIVGSEPVTHPDVHTSPSEPRRGQTDGGR